LKGSGADGCGEAITFLVGSINDDYATDTLYQDRLVLVTDQFTKLAFAGLVQRRDAQFE